MSRNVMSLQSSDEKYIYKKIDGIVPQEITVHE